MEVKTNTEVKITIEFTLEEAKEFQGILGITPYAVLASKLYNAISDAVSRAEKL